MTIIQDLRKQQEGVLERIRKLQRDQSSAPAEQKKGFDNDIEKGAQEVRDLDRAILEQIKPRSS